MKTIHLCMFDELFDILSEPVTIIIDEVIPEHKSLKESKDFHQDQTRQLIDALYNSLPQGTFDRLGIEFMKKKVSLYRGKTEDNEDKLRKIIRKFCSELDDISILHH